VLMPRPPAAGCPDERVLTFVETGLPRLLAELEKLGQPLDRLQIKLAGASHFLNSLSRFNTGLQNLTVTEEILATRGLPVTARAVGGAASVNVRFRLADGLVSVVAPGAEPIYL